jgi:hypothetical protein
MQIRKENITKSMQTHISHSTISPIYIYIFLIFPVYLRSISLLNKVKPGIADSNPKGELMLFFMFISKGCSTIQFTLYSSKF